MMNLDLKSARDAGTRAAEGVLECYDTVMNVRYESAAVSLAAITAALPHILEALAVALETDAQIAPDNAPDFHERYLAEKNIPKVRAFTALIRAKAAEARA